MTALSREEVTAQRRQLDDLLEARGMVVCKHEPKPDDLLHVRCGQCGHPIEDHTTGGCIVCRSEAGMLAVLLALSNLSARMEA